MNSAVETVSPTRVKLTVEVPFDELKPALDAAYKKVGQQVRIKGFRPGKVPPRLIDQYVGRGAVLEEAVNEAVPQFYSDAIREQEIDILGHPEIEVTEFGDGEQMVFIAQVDVRPEIELPEYDGLSISVEDAETTDDEVDEQLSNLRDRFATLVGVERAAADGDYVSIDLAATIDDESIDDATASNLSYLVGSDSLVEGLDAAITGLSADGSKEFDTQLRSGDHGGEDAKATVTVKSVKEKQAPELDDEFAQMASEFDTIDELKGDVRGRLARMKTMTQGVQARDKVLETLLDLIEVPMPEHVLEDEVAYRKQEMAQQLQAAGLTAEIYAQAEGKTVEDLDADIETGAKSAMKAQFVLDAIAKKEELQVAEADITDQIVRRAAQAGVRPDAYAQQIVSSGNLGNLMGDILRGKALALVMEKAVITDASGRPVDLEALTADDDSDDEDIEIIDADGDLEEAAAEADDAAEEAAEADEADSEE